jgi:hypothetical protein
MGTGNPFPSFVRPRQDADQMGTGEPAAGSLLIEALVRIRRPLQR